MPDNTQMPQNPLGTQTQPPPAQPQPAQPQKKSESFRDAYDGFHELVKNKNQGAVKLASSIIRDNPTGLTRQKFVQELMKRQPNAFEGIDITGLEQSGSEQKPSGSDRSGAKSFEVAGQGTVSLPEYVPSQKMPQRAWRNNNPGNLEFAGQAGATKGEDGFAVFAKPEDGYAAIPKQIAIDAERGMTLRQYITKYAPPSENNTAGYIARVTKQLGFESPNVPLSSVNPAKLQQLQAGVESGSKVTPAKQPQKPQEAQVAQQQKPQGLYDKLSQKAAGPLSVGGTLAAAAKPLVNPFESLAEGVRPYVEKIGDLGKGKGTVAEAGAGFVQGVAETGLDMTSLANVGIMAAAYGSGVGEAKFAAKFKDSSKLLKVAKMIPAMIKGGFTTQMLGDLKQNLVGVTVKNPQTDEDEDAGGLLDATLKDHNYKEAGRLAAKAIGDLFFIDATWGGKTLGKATDLFGGKKASAPPPEAPGKTAAEAPKKPTPEAPPKQRGKPKELDLKSAGVPLSDYKDRFTVKNSKFYLKGKEDGLGYTNAQLQELWRNNGELPKEETKSTTSTTGKKTEAPLEKSGPRLPEEHAGEDLSHQYGRRNTPLNFQSDIDKVAYAMSRNLATPEQVKWATEASGLSEKELKMQGSSKVRAGVVNPLATKAAHGDTLQVPKTIDTMDESKVKREAEKKATTEAKKTSVAKPAAEKKAASKPEIIAPGSGHGTPVKRELAGFSPKEIKVIGEVSRKKAATPKAREAAIRDAAADAGIDDPKRLKAIGEALAKREQVAQATRLAAAKKVLSDSKSKAEAQLSAAKDILKAAGKKGERGSVSNKQSDITNSEIGKALYIVGKDAVTRSGKDFAKWSKEIINEYGEHVREYLKPVWEKIHPPAKTAEPPARGEAQVRSIKPVAKAAASEPKSPGARSLYREIETKQGDKVAEAKVIKKWLNANPKAAKEYIEFIGNQPKTAVSKTAAPPIPADDPNTGTNRPANLERRAKLTAAAEEEKTHQAKPASGRVEDLPGYADLPEKIRVLHQEIKKAAAKAEKQGLSVKEATAATLRDYPTLEKQYRESMGQLLGITKEAPEGPVNIRELAEKDPKAAVKKLMAGGLGEKAARDAVKQYTEVDVKPEPKRTALPPEYKPSAPSIPVPRTITKESAPEARQEKAFSVAMEMKKRIGVATREPRHYPVELTYKDVNGKSLGKHTIDSPRDMDAAMLDITNNVIEKPEIAQIDYSGGGGKGTGIVEVMAKANSKTTRPSGSKGYVRDQPIRATNEPPTPEEPAGFWSQGEPGQEPEEGPAKGDKLKDTYGDTYTYQGRDKDGMHRVLDSKRQMEKLTDEEFEEQFNKGE